MAFRFLTISEFEESYEVDSAAGYIADSWLNGNRRQSLDLFLELNVAGRRQVLSELKEWGGDVYRDFTEYLIKDAYLSE